MNIFVLDNDPVKAAQCMDAVRVRKMIIESGQMMRAALGRHGMTESDCRQFGILTKSGNPWSITHKNHPCTLWAMQTAGNYRYAYSLYCAMLDEYTYRYGKVHGASKHREALYTGEEYIPEGWQTPHPQCFSGLDHLKTDEQYPIKAYREFYKADKLKFARYTKGRSMPEWMAA